MHAGTVTGNINTDTSHQWRSFKVDPSSAKCPGSGTEIIPGKHSDTRIKPLPLTNGHGRYTTVTTEQTRVSVGEWPLHITVINKCVTVSLPKRFRNGRFTSETAVPRFQN
jgi:hypothetical protein